MVGFPGGRLISSNSNYMTSDFGSISAQGFSLIIQPDLHSEISLYHESRFTFGGTCYARCS